VQLFIGGLHELAEAGLIPVGPTEMAVIGPIVKNNVLFVLAVLLVPFFAIATARKGPAPQGEGPEARLARARDVREKRGLRIAAVLSAVILAVLGVSFVRAESGRKLVAVSGGEVRIPVASVSDGRLHRFAADVSGHEARFLVIRAGRELRTAFDACQICGAEGYNEVGNGVVCLHCDANINIPTIGRAGGCNPIPLPSRVAGDSLVIREADLAAQAGQFPAAGR
jgi:uncharacterized membrane protein